MKKKSRWMEKSISEKEIRIEKESRFEKKNQHSRKKHAKLSIFVKRMKKKHIDSK